MTRALLLGDVGWPRLRLAEVTLAVAGFSVGSCAESPAQVDAPVEGSEIVVPDAGPAEGTGGTTKPHDSRPGQGPNVELPNTGGAGGQGPDEPPNDNELDSQCASSEVAGTLKPANLLFVVDQSGSMNCTLPEFGYDAARCAVEPVAHPELGPSKWELTRAALGEAFEALQSGGTPVSVGLTLFPQAPSRCDVPRQPDVPIAELDSTQNDRLTTALQAVEPVGETPLNGATILSYAYFHEQLLAGNLPGSNFVVLMTDGRETCAQEFTDILLYDDVPEARLLDIRTFVIGAPGSEEARSFLSDLATAGGTQIDPTCSSSADSTNFCHFDMTESEDFAADLASALAEITGTVMACELAVPANTTGEGVDLQKVNVRVNDTDFNRVDGCARSGEAGWQYNEDSTLIVLCGGACEAAQANHSVVRIVLGCPTRVP